MNNVYVVKSGVKQSSLGIFCVFPRRSKVKLSVFLSVCGFRSHVSCMYILKGVCASMQVLFCCCLKKTSCIFMHVVFINKKKFGGKINEPFFNKRGQNFWLVHLSFSDPPTRQLFSSISVFGFSHSPRNPVVISSLHVALKSGEVL